MLPPFCQDPIIQEGQNTKHVTNCLNFDTSGTAKGAAFPLQNHAYPRRGYVALHHTVKTLPAAA